MNLRKNLRPAKDPEKLAVLKKEVLWRVLKIQEIKHGKTKVNKKLKQLREEIWITILPYLKGTIRREFRGWLDKRVCSLDELVNEAYLLITDSVNKFDWRRGRDALGYLMDGAKIHLKYYLDMQTHLRSYGWQVLQKKKKIEAELRQKLGREPSEEEVLQAAQEVEYTKGRKLSRNVLQRLNEVQQAQPKSLDGKLSLDTTRSFHEIIPDNSVDFEKQVEIRDILDKLISAANLPFKWGHILWERHVNDKNLEEIGMDIIPQERGKNKKGKKKVGISRERVRQYVNKAEARIRQTAQEIGITSDLLHLLRE